MALEGELLTRGHQVAREVEVRVVYKGQALGAQRMDMIVDEKLIIEVKSTNKLPGSSAREVFNYLKTTNLELALLLHFGPKPNFYRLISSNRSSDPPHPLHPPDPRTPS
jgi:GxxExxY protein